MSTDSVTGGRHALIWELIPWFVNGRLSDEEAASVSAHIEHCENCGRALSEQRRIFDAMQAEDTIAFASEAAYQKLAARLDAAPARSRTRPDARWFAAASVLAALGLAAWGAWTLQRMPGTAAVASYLTLTSPAAGASGVAQVRVVFTSDLSLSELERLMHSIDAHISDGPTEAGVFTLTLAPGRSSVAEAAASLAALRADPNVRFAEPVVSAP